MARDKEDTLALVRALLAKAESTEFTAEAEELTAKAAELMARYGIERAQLGKLHPESDKPADRVIVLANPRADAKMYLLAGLAGALRCTCIQLSAKEGKRLHVFGYESDLQRADVLYTSCLLQMEMALMRKTLGGQRHASERAWRRSFLLGFATVVTDRVKAAEARAEDTAVREDTPGMSTALVLADRKTVVSQRVNAAYPRTRKTRITYSGNGYEQGREAGANADIGGAKVGGGTRGRLGR